MSRQQRLDPPGPVPDQYLDRWLREMLSARFDSTLQENLPDSLLRLLHEASPPT